MNRKKAIIVGAGPAGLTAAYELLEKTGIKPIVFEMSGDIGGISKTINYKGNRIDMGGHRFFSKSDRVMQWWMDIFPLQGAPSRDQVAGLAEKVVPGPGLTGSACRTADPEKTDRVLLVRKRLSRILFMRKFFDYPISLNLRTFTNLGLKRTVKAGFSYLRACLFPIREEKSLEDFFINRFGRELYLTFFKDYTEKVWGVPCEEISPEWGAQRVKGVSVSKAILHALKRAVSSDSSLFQKGTETSLIEQFMYPKYGPGQLWEEVARLVEERGGEVHMMHRVVGFNHSDSRIESVVVEDLAGGGRMTVEGDFFFSTMPVKDLIRALGDGVPEEVSSVAEGLMYRDFFTVGLLLRRLRLGSGAEKGTASSLVPDNWIYIQESDVRACRLQIFNNWSPYMVRDDRNAWIGVEYMCSEEDDLWAKSDEELFDFAIGELDRIGVIDREDVLDGVTIRMTKVYPAYFGAYDRFHVIREFTDRFENLFLIGRNGMHRYNNQDHSMLTAMIAVENIVNGVKSKENIWSVNTEEEYHETK